jgi:hypothetical protein
MVGNEPAAMKITWRRRTAFALASITVVLAVSFVALLGLDVYLHHRVQYSAGVNVWGYRGAPVGRKQPGEIRILALGGSTAFGYGLPWDQSWPYYLEQKVNAHRSSGTSAPVTVVNLGIPTDSARTFVATLNDYAYLHGDIAIFYEGYNDLGFDSNPPKNTTNPAVSHYLAWRHQSPIFRWTGYFPIFPLALSEKASILLHGRSSTTDGEVRFRPDLATRASAAAMKQAADIGVSLERRLGKLTDVQMQKSEIVDANCGRWGEYCGAVEDAVHHALAAGQRAVVVTQPYFSDVHVEQQRALASMLNQRFGNDSRVRYVNLGRLLDLHDPQVAYDGMHLVSGGNLRVAEALVPTVMEMLSKS